MTQQPELPGLTPAPKRRRPTAAQLAARRVAKFPPIPHVVTLGANRRVYFVECWPVTTGIGETGTGWLRTFGVQAWR